MAIEIRPSAPPATPSGFPAGWLLNDCRPADRGHTLYHWEGPASTLADAFAAVIAAHPGGKPVVSRTPGAAVASIQLTVSRSRTDDEPVENPVALAPDTWQLTPSVEQVAVGAHPVFAGKAAKLDAIEAALSRGDIPKALAEAGDDAALRGYAAHRLAGISTYAAAGYSYRYEKHWSAAGFAGLRGNLADDIAAGGRVFDWSDVKGHAAAPFVEPKWIDADGDPNPYEWRLDGVAVSSTSEEITVSYSYTGAWKWSALLYDGGSWTPEIAAAPAGGGNG